MALNGAEMLIIAHFIARKRGKTRPKVLSLGYPDLLFSPSLIDRYLPQVRRADVAIRPDSEAIARLHGRKPGTQILEAFSLFQALGADLDLIDVADFGHGETIVNLNDPVDESTWKERYDVVIDPGSVEHCFNAPTALANVALMLRPGGYVYHQAAINYPNHGYYSFSPVLFVDFYAANGFDVGTPHCWRLTRTGIDEDGVIHPLFTIDATLREYADVPAGALIGMFTARKLVTRPIVWPIQRKYQAPLWPLKPALYIEEALAALPQVLGGSLDDEIKRLPQPA